MVSRLAHRLLVLISPLHRRASAIIGVLGAVVIVVGPIAFRAEARSRGLSMGWDEALYATLALFAVSLSRLGYPHLVLLRVFHFLAPALSASALFGAIARVLEERGPIFLGAVENHVVIGGLGNLGATLARHLMKHRHPVIAIERRGDAPAVTEMRAAGASLVLVGDMTAADLLRRARTHHADRVFLVSKSDVANLDAAFQVRRLAEIERVPRPPVIFAHVYDAGLGDALEGQIQYSGGASRGARIVTFNSYGFAAKALIGDLLRERLLGALRVRPGLCLARTRWPEGASEAPCEARGAHALDEDRKRLLAALRIAAEEPGDERFAIVGFGRFGRSVLRELLAVAPAGARFLVVERSESEARAGAEALAPPHAARCEFAVGDATAFSIIERITGFAPTAALVCTDNDLSNLRLAVELRRRGLRAVTRMSGPDAAELSRGLDEQGITVVGLGRLFRAAIPILTHERRLRACVNLDVHRTPDVDHLFYLAHVGEAERRRIGRGCIALAELPGAADVATTPGDEDLALVWHRDVERLSL